MGAVYRLRFLGDLYACCYLSLVEVFSCVVGRLPRDCGAPLYIVRTYGIRAFGHHQRMKEFELEPGEHVVLEARKHWFLFLAELLPYAILAVIPFALPKLLALVPPLASYATIFDYHTTLARAILGVWLLIMWTSAWGACTKYFLNVWVLTSQRIVDIKQCGFFSREVSSLFLSRVQDVTTEVIGVLPSLLNIGTIKVQSAGEDVEFIMHGIPRPEHMRDLILKYVSVETKSTGV
ncbi:hypothetical protein COZ83_02085 [Candidatus Kaiserbacteria bacterium CG_4_8_14_3_um_filter_50_23]|uniref:YdbS-like PH domain-containing protein n=2 Tax=Candidatus Kaiseribacteriota TaxID=1752734 RepID=A0A2H0YXV8_9BACT|nr:MAG: hypothetical protein COT23_01980 [Candidatus Kaiserbacteria bacterium CG08_land_8_20_14_0_20_50_21]PIW96201.1 MAG: hypothetical protein COZ83_02085 [Candidatus Kaiserbacteria bacterium CG_4_8_14_3_um_filter_50_23]